MAEPIREQVVRAFQARLDEAEGFRRVVRNDVNSPFSWDDRELPLANLLEGEERHLASESGLVHATLDLDVAILIRPKGLEIEIGPQMNQLAAAVVVAVGGDRVLGGTAKWVSEDGAEAPILASEEGAPPMALLVLHFLVEYDRAEFDPFSVVPGA